MTPLQGSTEITRALLPLVEESARTIYHKMNNLFSFLFRLSLLTLTAATSLHAGGTPVLEPGKGMIHIFGGGGVTTNYYNIDGILKRFDTLQTAFTAITFGLTASYGIFEHLELNADLPIGYFAISSNSRFPSRSVFSPIYYGLGATVQLIEKPVSASISSMIKIPPGFHNGIYNDPAHPSFLSDGYFQIATSLNAGINFEHVWTKGSIG